MDNVKQDPGMRFVLPDGTPTVLQAGDVIEFHERKTITITRGKDGEVISIHFKKEGITSREMKCSDVTPSSRFPLLIELLAAACGLTAEKSDNSNYYYCRFTLRT
jgi:hypothetical protein